MNIFTVVALQIDVSLHADPGRSHVHATELGNCKTWTLDCGLDRGLDHGLYLTRAAGCLNEAFRGVGIVRLGLVSTA